MSAPRPAVAVVVISDYGRHSDGDGDWDDLRATLGALARQTFAEPVETVLVDSTPSEDRIPDGVTDLVPDLRVVSGAGRTTAETLNAAVEATSANLVALLDGDCEPVPGWLDAAAAAMRAHPDAAAVSGRTTYPDRRLSHRILATLSRSYLDPGHAGPTQFISSNNAIFRREMLLAHPLGPFRRALAARLQAEAFRLAGGAFYFEPGMRVTHPFDGWPRERRIRRHVGYRAIRVRQLEPRMPHAWMIRLGVCAIPLVLAARILESWMSCVRAGRHYGLRWFELPAAFATAVGVHLYEIGGMREAFAEMRAAAPASVARSRATEG